jgi:hypothetical protein
MRTLRTAPVFSSSKPYEAPSASVVKGTTPAFMLPPTGQIIGILNPASTAPSPAS